MKHLKHNISARKILNLDIEVLILQQNVTVERHSTVPYIICYIIDYGVAISDVKWIIYV